jgi:uncharacterized membrane protein YeaQ/YmgE (transglycosylase-associated protein family)
VLILAILVFGLAAGWVAQKIRYGGQDVDWTLALISGFVGSFVGGLIFSLIAGEGFELRPSGIIGSILGALLVLALLGAWARRRPRV